MIIITIVNNIFNLVFEDKDRSKFLKIKHDGLSGNG